MKLPAGFDHEQRLWNKGVELVAGIDEVGRGAWAGPVVAAAVIFPRFFNPNFELFDSKLLSPEKREGLDKKIRKVGKFGIGVVGVSTINKVGIGQATQRAFKKAVKAITSTNCDYFLVDAFYIQNWPKENQQAIKGGDRLCASIAAASIVAKVYRDKLMCSLANNYPNYSFEKHKGYGTKLHQESILKHSLSRVHRKSFNLKFLLS